MVGHCIVTAIVFIPPAIVWFFAGEEWATVVLYGMMLAAATPGILAVCGWNILE